MATLGLTDIIGPIMVGPSSSHTAGALRIASMARSLCLAEPVSASFALLGSFAHTLSGHGTDKALVAGMLGLTADDARVRDSFRLAEERGLSFSFEPQPEADDYDHPNTIDILVVDADGVEMCVRGESIGGGAAVIRRIDGIDVRVTGESTSVVVRQHDERGALAHIAQSLSAHGANIATARLYREGKGKVAYTVLETDQEVGARAKAAIEAHPAILDVRIGARRRADADARRRRPCCNRAVPKARFPERSGAARTLPTNTAGRFPWRFSNASAPLPRVSAAQTTLAPTLNRCSTR